MTNARKLVLFDIDGTLLDCGGRTREPLARALESTFGTCGALRSNGFAGKTDDQIVYEALARSAVPDPEIEARLPEVRKRYADLLCAGLEGESVRILPGVVETLERLTRKPWIATGLLTGNWRRGAECKLGNVGLGGYFEFGVFGDDCRTRVMLPPLALTAARRLLGRAFEADDVLIVGDTPNDVASGNAHGIAVVGLATGSASEEDLRAAGASFVFRSLIEGSFLEPLLEIEEGT
jgi:phosphoglycolate phosphatase-like HAD superfamily hydrolase